MVIAFVDEKDSGPKNVARKKVPGQTPQERRRDPDLEGQNPTEGHHNPSRLTDGHSGAASSGGQAEAADFGRVNVDGASFVSPLDRFTTDGTLYDSLTGPGHRRNGFHLTPSRFLTDEQKLLSLPNFSPAQHSSERSHSLAPVPRQRFDRPSRTDTTQFAYTFSPERPYSSPSGEVILHKRATSHFPDRTEGGERSKISLTELLCQKPEDIFCAQDKDGDNEIMLAIIKHRTDYAFMMINLLVKRRQSKLLNLKNNDGYTALHLAVKVDLVPLTVKLMEAKVDYEIRDCKGNTPLHLACLLGRNMHVAALTGTYVEPKQEIRRTNQETQSVRNSDGSTRNGLRSNSASNIVQMQYSAPLQSRHTLQHRNELLVCRTTKKKYDPKVFGKVAELKNYQGWNCLHLAAQNSHFDIMEYLVVVLKVDVNSRGGNRGVSVCHIAVESQDLLLLMLLVRRLKPDVNVRTSDGWSPIEFAGFRKDVISAKVLTTYGAHVNEYHNCRAKASQGEDLDTDD